MKRNVAIIGSGGREHALACKLKQSPRLGRLYVIPGNAGTSEVAENVELDVLDNEAIVKFCKYNTVDLVVIGPDDPLAGGLADALRADGIAVFGPDKAAAEIEWSKDFAKNLMKEAKILTAASQSFTGFDQALEHIKKSKYPLVIKADGLARGKGVVICQNLDEAQVALERMMKDKEFGSAGAKVIIEEFLQGAEISLHAISDGKSYLMFPPAQDHKQIGEGDTGPNTGGMGTIAPLPWLSQDRVEELGKKIIEPALEELNKQERPFVGCLYPSVMLSENSGKVIEYNARFGDPEIQSYLRLMQNDLLDVLEACTQQKLAEIELEWSGEYACCICLASGGYPGDYKKGVEIIGIDEAIKLPDVEVFHAGTKMDGDKLVTNGGRVLNVTATGKTLEEALAKAYEAIGLIHFEGMQYRTDIGGRPAPSWASTD